MVPFWPIPKHTGCDQGTDMGLRRCHRVAILLPFARLESMFVERWESNQEYWVTV